MKLQAMEIRQHDTKLYLGSMRGRDLMDPERVRADVYNAHTDTGYQRRVTPKRAKDFANYISRGKGISPNSILLNVRAESAKFEPKQGNYGVLNIPDKETLWIVDGQHRIAGLRDLFESSSAEQFDDLELPVVIMVRTSDYEEAKQFVIINRTQKGVKPDLAERSIVKMVRKEDVLSLRNLPGPIGKDTEWRPKATAIVDILTSKDSDDPQDDFRRNPWFQNIRLPNEPKGTTIVSQKAFEDSLRPILNNDSFKGYGAQEIAVLLARYWTALRELWPVCFEQPDQYVVQRTLGINVLHQVLPLVVNFASRQSGKLTKDALTQVLKNMVSCAASGESWEKLHEEFWSVGGLAGMMGTSKRSVGILTAKLSDYLETGNTEEGRTPRRPFEL